MSFSEITAGGTLPVGQGAPDPLVVSFFVPCYSA